MYYTLMVVAVVAFSFQFLFNQKFEERSGNGMKQSLTLQAGFSLSGLVVLSVVYLVRNGFTRINGLGWFTLMMTLFSALNSVAFMMCSMKALGRINISLYSMFTTLGGMLLPSLLGIAFYNEGITVAKIVSVLLIILALAVTVKKGESKSGTIYYAAIFVLNGFFGVISKIYQSAPFDRVDEAAYMMITGAWSFAISLALLIIVTGKDKRFRPDGVSVLAMLGCGTMNYSGNLINLMSLAAIPASVYYPVQTAGIIVVSTLMSFFTKKKPSRRELAAVALSILGIAAMLIIKG